METLNLDLNKRYTYADYLTWADNERRELFDGLIKLMSPAPKRIHQIISGNLHRNLANFLFKKKCKVFYAPSDVRLLKDKFKIYEEHGVREYWIVYPNDCTVFVYLINELGKYQQVGIYAEDDKIPVNILGLL